MSENMIEITYQETPGVPVAMGDLSPPPGVSAFGGAAIASTQMRHWNPLAVSADSDVLNGLDARLSRSRDLFSESGIAAGGIQTIVDNVVGPGLRLIPTPNWRALGKTKEWADEWSRNVRSHWLGWADTVACDAADALIFDQLTALQLRSQLVNGDHLALPQWITDRGDGWATKLQTVESDRLSNPQNMLFADNIRGGVEFGSFGEPIAYHVRTTHPGDLFLAMGVSVISAAPANWIRIPKRTPAPFRRLRVIHGFDKQRSGQSRGKPILSPVLAEFKQLDRYRWAELTAAVLNSMIAGIIETPMSSEDIVELFKGDSRGYLQARRDHTLAGLSPGAMIPIMPGDKLQPFMPSRPATGYGAFVENVLRFIAVACDMPYELLSKDFTKASYSSARSAMLEAWRAFIRRRDSIVISWCDPVYELWLEEAINVGLVEAPDFYENRAHYVRARWIGPGRGWVDPLREAQAATERLDHLGSTLESEAAEQGRDWQDDAEQRASETAYYKGLSLPDPHAPKAPPAPPGAGAPADGHTPPDTTTATDAANAKDRQTAVPA